MHTLVSIQQTQTLGVRGEEDGPPHNHKRRARRWRCLVLRVPGLFEGDSGVANVENPSTLQSSAWRCEDNRDM